LNNNKAKIGDVSGVSSVQLELDEIHGKLSKLAKTTTCCNVGEALAFVGFAHEQLEHYFEWAEAREAEGVKVE